MKLHLPSTLFRTLIACVALAGASFADSVTYTFHQDGPLNISEQSDVIFENIQYTENGAAIYQGEGAASVLSLNDNVSFNGNTKASQNATGWLYGHQGGGAIYNNDYGSFEVSKNENVTFRGNTASGGYYELAYGGAIHNSDYGTFTLSDNGEVTFSGNTACASECGGLEEWGGAIFNSGTFELRGNGDVTFSGNTVSDSSSTDGSFLVRGGAILNVPVFYGYGDTFVWNGTFELSGNGNVTFSGNTASAFSASYAEEVYASGGAIDSHDAFTLSNNGNVTFSGNTVSACAYGGFAYGGFSGGAINCYDNFTLSGNGNVTFSGNTVSASSDSSAYASGGAISCDGNFTLSGNGDVTFSGNTATASSESYSSGAPGGAIYNEGTFTLSGNDSVTFSGNTATAASASSDSSEFSESPGGAIYNGGSFTLSGNDSVTFSGNTATASFDSDYCYASAYGGAIYNWYDAIFTLSDNGDVTFNGNTASASSAYGGAIGNNEGTFTLSGNDSVTFSGNTASACSAYAYGGAIHNYSYGTFELNDNGAVTFSGNTATASSVSDYCSAYGGAIYNVYSFTLSGNGDVLFEKNAEARNGTYRLRSIYSEGTLNLSASGGKSILFKDSVYASGTVNLNQDGAGDIIFTGISTEADLREVKGGVDGTVEEILNSRTSEIATNASLYGGRLIVEDGAILKGQGITVTEGANATIRLKDATLNETGYAIAVSAGSGLEFEGENLLSAASVQMADGAFLSFVMGEDSGTNWDAQLITGQLNVKVSGDLFNEHSLLTLNDASQYDTSRWTSDAVTVSGADFDSLSWADGVLTYTPHVITPDADGSLDEALPDDGNAIIDGNGHTLTVKNEVQLVQMALKDGIVKLEGENNGIVSVTLTEGGELVLTAGAGLKTGDIISMVASGKGELIISGDITLDNKGMRGKAGAQATVSHAEAQVLGDATISNVRVEDSVIDLAEGSTVTFSHVSLAAGSRITDDPATLALDDVTAELKLGVNTAVVSVDEVLQAGSTLVQNGNETMSLTLAQDAVVVQLEATTFDSVTLTGDSLVLQLSGVETEFFNGADYIAVTFTRGSGLATFGTDVEVLLTLDEEHFVHGYYVQGSDHTAMLFATEKDIVVTPEPATSTLSLLALAALAARRRRK